MASELPDIETLSDVESIDLRLAGSGPGFDYTPTEEIAKALRIIEQQRERLRLFELAGAAPLYHYQQRAKAAESECATLRAEVACIRAEAELTETRLSEARAEVERLRAREGGVDNLDAQIVELRTEVERLRAELALESELATLHAGGASRAESRLSAATELLERTSKVAHEDDLDARIALVDAVDAFLAAQPAAPARTAHPAACLCEQCEAPELSDQDCFPGMPPAGWS